MKHTIITLILITCLQLHSQQLQKEFGQIDQDEIRENETIKMQVVVGELRTPN